MTLKKHISTLALASILGLTLAHPGFSQTAADSDGDGVPDTAEVLLGTDPMVADTDGDTQNDLADADPAFTANPIDSQIITELNTGTVAIGAAGTIPTVSLYQNAVVKLQNASVPWDSRITFLCAPSYVAYLEQTPEFSNAQYVDLRPYAGDSGTASWRDKPPAYRWRNTLIVPHPNLPGKGTSSEKSFMFHQSAIGHGMNVAGLETPVGYNEEQGYSWARASAFMGAKLLQNTGVVQMMHDGSAYVGT